MEKFANHIGYTDINPFEVIKVISEKTLVIRAMDAVRDPNWKPNFVVGGFSAMCLNQNTQEWNITSNSENEVLRIRLGKKGWKDKYGNRYQLAKEPVKFYDYNF